MVVGKQWLVLVIAHYRVGASITQPHSNRRRGAKLWNNAPSYNCIHSSSYRNLAVGKEFFFKFQWRHSNIRFWSEQKNYKNKL